MIFWVVAGIMTVLTLLLLVRPLLLRPARTVSPAHHDLAVYRDQLAEVDRDVERGVLTPEQAQAARLEIERRILAAAEADKGKSRRASVTPPSSRTAARDPQARPRALMPIVLAVLLPVAAVGVYSLLGAPGVPSLPFADRTATQPDDRELAALVKQLGRRMAERPEDVRGWLLLARSHASLGNYAESVEAYREAIARGSDGPEVQSSLGEALVGLHNGVVVAEAGRAFAAALEADPADVRARYYTGLAFAQRGRNGEALQVWEALADDIPSGVPFRAALEGQIRQIASLDGAAPAAPPAEPSGAGVLSAEEIEAVAAMSPEERGAFIRSMVERLAARVQDRPGDLNGWHRLGRAYVALGETEKARSALEHAAKLAKDLPPGAPERQAVEAALAVLPPVE